MRTAWCAVVAVALAVGQALAGGETGGCVYRGQPRSEQWLDEQYAAFRDTIDTADGRWTDRGKDLAAGGLLDSAIPGTLDIGDCRAIKARTILLVLGPDEMLLAHMVGSAHRPSGRPSTSAGRQDFVRGGTGAVLHVKGIPTEGLTAGGTLDARLIYAGSYQYKTLKGVVETVPSFRALQAPTREEFAGTLEGGFILRTYQWVPIRDSDKNVCCYVLQSAAVP